MVCTGNSDVHQNISMYCLAQDDCNVFTFDKIYAFCKIEEREKNRNCTAINNINKISFISTFREEYLLSEKVIFIILNVQ